MLCTKGILVRIVIDARKISDFGIGEYIRQLLLNFNKYTGRDEFFIIVRDAGSFPLSLGSNFHLLENRAGLYSMRELLHLGISINRLKADIVHFPHFTVPFFISRESRVITTIHDLIHRKFIDLMFTPLHKYYLLPVLRYAVSRSDSIISVSRKTKDDIVRHYGVADRKIRIIYNGLNGFDEAGKASLDGLNIKIPYFLYVGNLKFHKNLINTVRGFSMFQRESGADVRLVLAGVENNKSLGSFKNYIKRYIDLSRIITTGYLSSAELSLLYKKASGLCLASLCEGFGLPALEATQFKTPVIASSSSPMEEFLPEGTVYVNPYSIKEMKDAFSYVYSNRESLRESMDTKFLEDFRWYISAEKTYGLYREIYEAKNR
jgi:glycosyltransferase involved in cell wall biosynthesis